MARKRPKPAAAPRDTPPAATRPATQPDPDVFDQAIAARHAGQFETAPPADPSAAESTTPVEPPPPAEPVAPREHPLPAFTARAEKQPDPFAEYRISLTRDDTGPAMRLYRNRYLNLAAIRFDEKPSDPIRTQLQQGGFSWKQQDRVWVKPLGSRPGEEHRRVRELFEELADQIRAENGMPPIRKGGLAV
jgi:hypothetical protein